jgi:hypothetical protein
VRASPRPRHRRRPRPELVVKLFVETASSGALTLVSDHERLTRAKPISGNHTGTVPAGPGGLTPGRLMCLSGGAASPPLRRDPGKAASLRVSAVSLAGVGRCFRRARPLFQTGAAAVLAGSAAVLAGSASAALPRSGRGLVPAAVSSGRGLVLVAVDRSPLTVAVVVSRDRGPPRRARRPRSGLSPRPDSFRSRPTTSPRPAGRAPARAVASSAIVAPHH